MAKNISEIPYTELVERSRKLARVGNNTVEKIRGIIQDVATREMPSKFDWDFLLVGSSFVTYPQYNTGTVSINTGDTTVLFSSDAVLDSTFVCRKIVFSGNDQVYKISGYNNTTSLTISPALQGDSNITSGSYVTFQDTYPMSSDFDRLPKMGGVYYWLASQKKTMEEEPYRQTNDNWTYNPVTIPNKVRLVGLDSAGNQLVQIIPPPSVQRNYGYDYFKQVKPMIETTAGTISLVNAGATTVTGNTNTRFLDAYTNSSSNLWFRVDALGTGQDSEWFRVLSIQHNSSLTLSTAFANTAITSSANYTICSSPNMPARMHIGVLYGTIRSLELDQNDENYLFYHVQYAQVLSDSKRIYVSRPYNIDVPGIQEEYRYRY